MADTNFAWMDDDLSGEISNTADTLQGADINAWGSSDSVPSHWLDDIWSIIGSPTAKNLLNFGSGIYGLTQADKMKQLAKQAMGASDPFGGQRAQYAQQLATLMKDPSSIKSDPSYQFQLNAGADAVERSMAAKGFLGSGNEAIALTEYGQKFGASFLDQRMKFLADLAGAGISPNFGASLSGYASGIDTASAALASLGYGATMAGQPSKPSRPNSAGGEAAAVGGLASLAGKTASGLGATTVGGALSDVGGIVSGVAKGGVGGYTQAGTSAAKLGQLVTGGSVASRVGATGPDPSGIGYVTPTAGTGGINVDSAIGTAGDLASIYTGIDQGGVGGYAKAASGLADLAGYNVPALGYVDAATKLAEGDVGSAGYSAAITYAGPVAAIGSAIADYFNKGGDKDSAGVSALMKSLTDTGQLTLVNPKNGLYKLPDGRYIQAGKAAQTFARTLMNHASNEETNAAWEAWLATAGTDWKKVVRGG